MIKAFSFIALFLALGCGRARETTMGPTTEPRACERQQQQRLGRSYAREHRIGRSYARAGLFWSAAIAVQR